MREAAPSSNSVRGSAMPPSVEADLRRQMGEVIALINRTDKTTRTIMVGDYNVPGSRERSLIWKLDDLDRRIKALEEDRQTRHQNHERVRWDILVPTGLALLGALVNIALGLNH